MKKYNKLLSLTIRIEKLLEDVHQNLYIGAYKRMKRKTNEVLSALKEALEIVDELRLVDENADRLFLLLRDIDRKVNWINSIDYVDYHEKYLADPSEEVSSIVVKTYDLIAQCLISIKEQLEILIKNENKNKI